MMTDPLVLEMIGAAVRWLLAVAGGYLVAHHVINADQSERFTNDLVRHALLAAPVVASLVWSLCAKYKARLRFIAAADSERFASEASINDKAKTTAVKAQAFTGTL